MFNAAAAAFGISLEIKPLKLLLAVQASVVSGVSFRLREIFG